MNLSHVPVDLKIGKHLWQGKRIEQYIEIKETVGSQES